MRTVLYADDMEPITVIELGEFAAEHIKKYGSVRIPVEVPFSICVDDSIPVRDSLRVVVIRAERFIRNGAEHMMLFTEDEESSLLLKCAFLPGQLRWAQEKERESFSRGILFALCRMGERE